MWSNPYKNLYPNKSRVTWGKASLILALYEENGHACQPVKPHPGLQEPHRTNECYLRKGPTWRLVCWGLLPDAHGKVTCTGEGGGFSKCSVTHETVPVATWELIVATSSIKPQTPTLIQTHSASREREREKISLGSVSASPYLLGSEIGIFAFGGGFIYKIYSIYQINIQKGNC